MEHDLYAGDAGSLETGGQTCSRVGLSPVIPTQPQTCEHAWSVLVHIGRTGDEWTTQAIEAASWTGIVALAYVFVPLDFIPLKRQQPLLD